MAFQNKRELDLTNFVQKVSDDPQEVSAEVLYDNTIDKPTEIITKEYADATFYERSIVDGLLDTKMNEAVTQLGSSGASLHSVNNRTLSLKRIRQGTNISVTENAGEIIINNTSPNIVEVDDTQISSTTAYSSQKLTDEYVPYTNVHNGYRTSTSEIYNANYINSLETSLTTAINQKAPINHTHVIGDITNLTATLNAKLSNSVTQLGATGTTIHTVNGTVLGLKTFESGTAIDITENSGIITVTNTAPNQNEVDDTQTTSNTTFSSQKITNDYFPKANVFGSFRSGNNEVYNAPYVNAISTAVNGKIGTVNSLGASGTVLFTLNNSVLGLKTLAQGSGINVAESNGIVTITNVSPNEVEVDDSQTTSSTTFSSQRITNDYFLKTNIFGSLRTSADEIYNAPYVNTLSTSINNLNTSVSNINTALGNKLSTSVTSLGASGTVLFTVNGTTLGLKTITNSSGINVTENAGIISIENTAMNQDEIDDTQTTATTTFSSNKITTDYFPIVNVFGSFRTGNNEVYNAPFVNSISTSVGTKMNNSVTTLGASGIVLYTVNSSTLGLKTITDGAGISLGESNGVITVTNTAMNQNEVDDSVITSTNCFSSNKTENDYFKKIDLHNTARTSAATEAYSVGYINNLVPTSATEDLFITTTSVAGTHQLSTKLSTGPARFGHGTPTSMHAYSTFVGVSAGSGTSDANIITAIGRQAAEGGNVGGATTCIGYRAGDGSSGVRNTFIGHLAGNGVTGNDLFALGEGSMDGGSCTKVTGIGRYAFRGATATNCIGLGINVMGSGFGFHTYATNSPQRSGTNKFLIGDNTNTNFWTTANQYTGSPYLLDGTMGGYDSVREMRINANDIYFGEALPTSNSTAQKVWVDQGVLRYGSGPSLSYTDTELPSQTGQQGKVLSTDGTNPLWTNKIGSSTAHTLFYWAGGVPNHYLLNQATSTTTTGSDLAANGSFENYASSFSIPSSGYAPIITPNTSGTASDTTTITGWDVEKPANHEFNNCYFVNNSNTVFSSQSQSGSHFVAFRGVTLRQNRNLTSGKNYKLSWYEKTRSNHSATDLTIKVNNVVESVTHTLTSSWVLNTCTFTASQTSCDIDFIAKEINSTTDLNTALLDNVTLFELSGGTSELGNIAFGTTGGTFYSSIAAKVRDSTAGQLRGYIQINTQHGDSSPNLDEETLRIGESSHSLDDAGEFFGNLKVAGVKFAGNTVQTLPVIAPTAGEVGRFLSATSTGAWGWSDKIGSTTSYVWTYWSGGTPNQYFLNQASSAGDQCGAIVFGNTNGTMYSSMTGKVRSSTSGALRGYIQFDTQSGDSNPVLTEETLRIGESSHSLDDAGEFFGNLKVAGVKFAGNTVQTLPVIAPAANEVGRFLSATSTGAWDWSDKVGSSTSYVWTYWSGGIPNQYFLNQASSAGDQCGAIVFGTTGGTMYSSMTGKVRSSTSGALRGYIQFDTQSGDSNPVLTEETLRIGESTHDVDDAAEFFGDVKLTGVKFSNNAVQSAAVTAPTSTDATNNRVLTATGTGTWGWADPPSGVQVKNALFSGATQNGLEIYNCFYHDTVRSVDVALINTKLDESHVQSAYQATPNADDVYNCAHHDSAFKNTYGILYGATQSSCYTTGYVNQFYREENNQRNITLVSPNTSQNDTLGSVQAWNGNNHISSAIAFCHSNEPTVSGRINFYSYTNNNHATQGPSAYIQDDVTNVKDLEAIGSITLDSTSNTSNIINTCPANPKFISKSSTSTSTAVIGNVQTQAFINVTGNVQFPPALSSNTSTVSGVTYTLSASTNAFTGSQYDMYKAFDRINGTGWHSHGNYNSSNVAATMGQYQGSNSLGGVNGEWIQIQMSSAQPFGSVKVIGRQGYDPQAADSWEILASNNGTSWTSILQSTVHLTYNGGNGHTIPISNTTSYTHYAIIAKTVAGPSSAYLTIHEIEFYTVTTTAYGEFTDLKTTKYGNDWGLLDINVRQNAGMTPLVRIGKSQASDPYEIMWNGKTQCTDTFSVQTLKIQGTGSNIQFNNGLTQTQPLVDPTTTNYNNKAVLTAGPTGTWNWDVPPFVTKNNYVEISSLALLPTSYDANNPLRVWLDGAGTSTGSNVSGVLRVGAVNTQYDSSTGAHNNVLQCANSNSSIFAFTHTSKARVQNNKHNLTIVTNSNAEFVYTFDVKPAHAYYIITAQHENTYSVNSETDLNSFITNKTVNGFTLTFRQGDNGTLQDSPALLCDHSVSIMGVSANQIDTTSQTIPQLGQTNVFPTGFNLA